MKRQSLLDCWCAMLDTRIGRELVVQPEAHQVRGIIETCYWPREVHVPYTQMLDRRRAEPIAARSKRLLGLGGEPVPQRIVDCRHIFGWCRVDTQ